ncbi:putative cytochrome b5 protein [Xylariaceae sp. FL1651]|nr:putative cytochrome b5 protein [Xylariaceae sp. FL1651]
MSKTFTAKEVGEHKDEQHGMYIIVDSDFLDEHPGGAKILKRMAGKNATKQFWKYHNKTVLEKYGGKLKVGELAETAKL